MKTPPHHHRKKISPSCLHVPPKLLLQTQWCTKSVHAIPSWGAGKGSWPLAHVRRKSADSLNCMRGGLDLHTCTHSPRDGDAHPICQRSEKHAPSPFVKHPSLPSTLCASMTCKQTRPWVLRSWREAWLCHSMGLESGCALASARTWHSVSPNQPVRRWHRGTCWHIAKKPAESQSKCQDRRQKVGSNKSVWYVVISLVNATLKLVNRQK